MAEFREDIEKFIGRERGNLARLAAETGLSHTALWKIASGRTPNPGILTVQRIQAALARLEQPEPSTAAGESSAQEGAA